MRLIAVNSVDISTAAPTDGSKPQAGNIVNVTTQEIANPTITLVTLSTALIVFDCIRYLSGL